MAIFNRIAGRVGNQVALTYQFLQGGVPFTPYAFYRIEIFRCKVAAENMVAAFDFPVPGSSSYPSPMVSGWPDDSSAQAGVACLSNQCATSGAGCFSTPSGSGPVDDGKYTFYFDVPKDSIAPDTYFDVIYYYTSNPVVIEPDGDYVYDNTDIHSQYLNTQESVLAFDLNKADTHQPPGFENPLDGYIDKLTKQSSRFFVYPENNAYVDSGLETIRLGYEPLDTQFMMGESRPLDIGITPLPLYDFNYNLIAPIIPMLRPTITIWTSTGQLLNSCVPGKMKLRSGSFRTNPFVASFMINTCNFFTGTYRYRMSVQLPNGETRVSPDYFFSIM